eukprot:3761823-Rhodomonas_salina.1
MKLVQKTKQQSIAWSTEEDLTDCHFAAANEVQHCCDCLVELGICSVHAAYKAQASSSDPLPSAGT